MARVVVFGEAQALHLVSKRLRHWVNIQQLAPHVSKRVRQLGLIDCFVEHSFAENEAFLLISPDFFHSCAKNLSRQAIEVGLGEFGERTHDFFLEWGSEAISFDFSFRLSQFMLTMRENTSLSEPAFLPIDPIVTEFGLEKFFLTFLGRGSLFTILAVLVSLRISILRFLSRFLLGV